MRILSPTVHGILDFVVVLVFLIAPSVLEFWGTPRTVCYIVAVLHAVMTLLTAFPLGVVKLIRFPVHGLIEVIAGLVLIAIPFVMGFTDGTNARDFFVGAGVALLIVVLLTDYWATERV